MAEVQTEAKVARNEFLLQDGMGNKLPASLVQEITTAVKAMLLSKSLNQKGRAPRVRRSSAKAIKPIPTADLPPVVQRSVKLLQNPSTSASFAQPPPKTAAEALGLTDRDVEKGLGPATTGPPAADVESGETSCRFFYFCFRERVRSVSAARD